MRRFSLSVTTTQLDMVEQLMRAWAQPSRAAAIREAIQRACLDQLVRAHAALEQPDLFPYTRLGALAAGVDPADLGLPAEPDPEPEPALPDRTHRDTSAQPPRQKRTRGAT